MLKINLGSEKIVKYIAYESFVLHNRPICFDYLVFSYIWDFQIKKNVSRLPAYFLRKFLAYMNWIQIWSYSFQNVVNLLASLKNLNILTVIQKIEMKVSKESNCQYFQNWQFTLKWIYSVDFNLHLNWTWNIQAEIFNKSTLKQLYNSLSFEITRGAIMLVCWAWKVSIDLNFKWQAKKLNYLVYNNLKLFNVFACFQLSKFI